MSALVSVRAVNSVAANVTSQAILLPDGWQVGDWAIWCGIVNTSTGPLTLPTADGWTMLDGTPLTVGSSILWVAWQRLTATSKAPTATDGTTSKMAQAMLLLRGAATTAGPIVGGRYTRPVSAATTPGVGVTTTAANQRVVSLFMEKSSNSTTVAISPTGPTERVKTFGTGGGQVSVYAVDEVKPAAGATGTRTATYDIASTVGYALSVAIPDEPAAPTGSRTLAYALDSSALAARRTYSLTGGVLT